ncbi:unnamed protein product, partial [Brassica napus]
TDHRRFDAPREDRERMPATKSSSRNNNEVLDKKKWDISNLGMRLRV